MKYNLSVASRRLGVNFTNEEAHVCIWAPFAEELNLVIEESHRLILHKEEEGYWNLVTKEIKPGDSYWVDIKVAEEWKGLPDPSSLSQPKGPLGPSVALNLRDVQFSEHWTPMPLSEYIIYELHVGTFTPKGTFEGVEEKLDYLLELGITAIEIMPVAAFPGTRNWGYDGVFPFAVQESYGGALGLRKLVKTCHRKGLSVILDVVYNHLGPEGNFFSSFGPYFTDKYRTPWGDAINVDDAWSDPVRFFILENMLMWFRDFHIDALRLDAVHAIKDFSVKHILQEMQECLDSYNKQFGQSHYLIVESDLNDPRFINTPDLGGYGLSAQWVDEFHHALRVAVGEPPLGYYADFNGLEHLAKAYSSAYVYDGQYSQERKRTFGAKAFNSGDQFVVFSQNHDQTGNRMLGERSAVLYSFPVLKILIGAVMVSPYIPMLFMGEEWGAKQPFLYFINHENPELIEQVRKGRAEEFKHFQQQAEVPDPQSLSTFERSMLNWDDPKEEQSKQLFLFYKHLIHLRKNHPALNSMNRERLRVESFVAENALILHRYADDENVLIAMNFSSTTQLLPLGKEYMLHVIIDSSASKYGGPGRLFRGQLQTDTVTILPNSIIIFSYV